MVRTKCAIFKVHVDAVSRHPQVPDTVKLRRRSRARQVGNAREPNCRDCSSCRLGGENLYSNDMLLSVGLIVAPVVAFWLAGVIESSEPGVEGAEVCKRISKVTGSVTLSNLRVRCDWHPRYQTTNELSISARMSQFM